MARWRNQHPFCLFDYTTVKYVATQNKKVGFIYRIFQLTVMGYLIGWVFVTKKEYQSKDESIESSVVTKVKGIALVNTTDSQIWGPEDYVFPNQGENFLFVITNYIETPNQRMGNCSENPEIQDANCTTDEDCRVGEPVRAGNGIKTGRCLEIDSESNRTCEIYGWCPTEKPPKCLNATVIREAENFTLYIRNYIRFSKFNFSKSNVVLNESYRSYLKNCTYDEITQPYCPIFRLGDIVSKAGRSFQEVAEKGASFGILIEWSCDLDKDDSHCHPRYHFLSLNNNTSVAGNSFRLAHYSKDAGRRQRTLYKMFGIHLDVIAFGTARKFSIIHTIINIASVLTLMTAGSFLCDIILLCLMKKSTHYRASKFERITKNDKEIPVKKTPERLKRKFSL